MLRVGVVLHRWRDFVIFVDISAVGQYNQNLCFWPNLNSILLILHSTSTSTRNHTLCGQCRVNQTLLDGFGLRKEMPTQEEQTKSTHNGPMTIPGIEAGTYLLLRDSNKSTAPPFQPNIPYCGGKNFLKWENLTLKTNHLFETVFIFNSSSWTLMFKHDLQIIFSLKKSNIHFLLR